MREHKPGEIVSIAGTEFVLLSENHRGEFLVLLKEPFGKSTFGLTNDYRNSVLKDEVEKWLHTLFNAGLREKNVVLRYLDCCTVDGYTGYGNIVVHASPLTVYQFAEYREYIPKSDCYWLATGFNDPACDDCSILAVRGDCGLYVNFCENECGIRPAMYVTAEAFDDYAHDLKNVSTDTLLQELASRMK